MFVVKNDDGKNDHKSYNSIYFNYFLISYYRVRLFLAMQVRVMAACMESQSFIRSAQSRPRDGTCVSDVCVCEIIIMYQHYADIWCLKNTCSHLIMSSNGDRGRMFIYLVKCFHQLTRCNLVTEIKCSQ